MGRWGFGLFEGDHDLDEVMCMSSDAGFELYHYELPQDSEDDVFRGIGLEATRNRLNDGVLTRLFAKYTTEPIPELDNDSDKKLRLILLGALAMRVGATITPDNMTILRAALPQIRVCGYALPIFDSNFREVAKDQVETALAHYKNDGTPYDFNADRCGNKICRNAQDELPEGQRLMACSKCKETSYCSKECQKNHWGVHKKSCKTPEKRQEEENERERRFMANNQVRGLNV